MLETSEPTAQRIETVNRRFVSADSIVVHCKMGGRSANAVQFLREIGFKKAVNLDGIHLLTSLNTWAHWDPQVPSDQTDLDLWEDQGGAAR